MKMHRRFNIFLFFVFLFFAHSVSGQQKTDSLLNIVNQTDNDTIKLITIKKIATCFYPVSLDSSSYYAQKMLVLALQKQNIYYTADAYDLLSQIDEKNGNLHAAVQHIDSAIRFSKLLNDSLGLIYFYTNKGSVYLKAGIYFDALQCFEKVKSIGEVINRPDRVAAALNNIGAVYHYLNDDKTSLDFFIQSYNLRFKHNLTNKLAYTLNNIGAIYSKYGNYNEALIYHKKALEAALSQNDRYNYLVALINIGLDYDFLKDYSKSMKYYEQALGEATVQNDQTSQSHVLERMSVIDIKMGSYGTAEKLLQKALDISYADGNKYDIASFSNSLAKLYLKQKKLIDVLPLLDSALKTAKEITAPKIIGEIYSTYNDYYFLIDNIRKAYKYQKLFDAIKDSSYMAEAELKIANLKNRFELNQKLKELEEKDIDLTFERNISSKRLSLMYIASLAVFVLLVFIIYIFILYRKIRLKNRLIHQNEQKVKDLLEKEKELGNLKTQLISTVSHEFRTPMAIITSNVQMLNSYYNSMDEKMRQETLKYISGSVNNMISMMRNFEVLDKNSILEFQPEKFNLSEFCSNLINEIQSLPKYMDRINLVDKLNVVDVVADKGLITHIIRNLLINGIKFSKNLPVDFLLENSSDKIIFTITDHGIGMSDTDATKVFDNFYRGANVGSVKGTGVGMSVVKRCVNLHGGTIEIKSMLGKGTTIKVILPFS